MGVFHADVKVARFIYGMQHGYFQSEGTMHALGDAVTTSELVRKTPTIAILAASDQNVPPPVVQTLYDWAKVLSFPGMYGVLRLRATL